MTKLHAGLLNGSAFAEDVINALLGERIASLPVHSVILDCP
jgi:hypothetical protein